MNKQKKQTLIVAIVLVVLVGLYFLSDLIPDTTDDTDTTVEEVLFEYSSSDISSVNFIDSEGEELTFTQTDGTWVLEGYEDRTVTTTYMNTIISGITKLGIELKMENVTDYEQYGLNEPSHVVYFTAADGDHTITFGDHVSDTGVYYIMVDDDPAVYAYSHSYTLAFDHEAEYFLDDIEEEETEEVDAEAETSYTDVEAVDTVESEVETEVEDTTEAVEESTETVSANE